MRIAQIVPSLEVRHGGPSVSVPALAEGLAGIGHDVVLLSTGPKHPAPIASRGQLLRIFPRDRPEIFCPSAGLRTYVSKLDADILHSHGLWLRPLHYAHRRVQQRSAARLVISPRGMASTWAWNRHRWQKILANRFIHPGALEAAHGWHATSEAEAGEIRALGFTQPICVAPNGVRAPAAAEMDRAKAHWERLCPEAVGRPTALFYSRLHPKKRVLELIDVWLAQAPADWLLLVIGVPEAYTIEQLSNYVLHRSGSGRILVFDGREAPAPYAIASLFLLPSHSENFGLVIAEALSHGLPAVVTDTTPWEGLQAAGHGWCVAWDQFGTAMRAALDEGPERLKKRGQGARRWVLERFSWEESARRLSSFYTSLLS